MTGEPTENPRPSYSSYLTQQQMVADMVRLRLRVDDLEKQIEAMAVNLKVLMEQA